MQDYQGKRQVGKRTLVVEVTNRRRPGQWTAGMYIHGHQNYLVHVNADSLEDALKFLKLRFAAFTQSLAELSGEVK